MYKYLTIESIIAIKEYKSYEFSIRKIAKAIDYSKSTVHRVDWQPFLGHFLCRLVFSKFNGS